MSMWATAPPGDLLPNSLTKVAAREFATGAGLEVAFESHRGFFFVELDDDQRSPGAAYSGVR